MRFRIPAIWIPAVVYALVLPLMASAAGDGSVEARVSAWVETFNKNDPQAMVSFYEDTEELDMLVSAGLWHRGIEEIKEAYQKDKKNWKYYDSNLRGLRVRYLDDVALAAFQHLFKLKSLNDDVSLQIHIRTTMTLRKIDGEWKIVSEHSSSIDGIERVVPIGE